MFPEYCDYKLFFIYMYDPLIFDLMTLQSNQFIGFAIYILVLSLIVIHPSVLMRMRWEAIYAYIISPMTFGMEVGTVCKPPQCTQAIQKLPNELKFPFKMLADEWKKLIKTK